MLDAVNEQFWHFKSNHAAGSATGNRSTSRNASKGYPVGGTARNQGILDTNPTSKDASASHNRGGCASSTKAKRRETV
ncbi:hypothetical protein BDW74DRAFT_149241 [Aspergillus multicolor]|uniref:uncharacterized protein n=1 Tax=Aspergillus multicolor TaxID=41759 RepID=UPI003CCDC232